MERPELGIHGLVRATGQLHRRAYARPIELPVVEQKHARRSGRNESRGTRSWPREDGGRPRLIVVLEEADRALLVSQIGSEMGGDALGRARSQTVEEGLVVGVVEAEFLKSMLAAPVRLRDQGDVRISLAEASDGVPPELPTWAVAIAMLGGSSLPGRTEHVVDDEHGRVATNPVAARRDLPQRVGHGRAQGGNAVVQLRRVLPGGKVRVAPMGEVNRVAARTVNQLTGSVATCSEVPWTYQSGLRQTHRWSVAVWLGTKSRTRPTPDSASCRRSVARPDSPPRLEATSYSETA